MPSYSCGCEEIKSPLPGVLWAADSWGGGEVQRCDTHQPQPLFETDRDAAEAMKARGYKISEDPDDGTLYAEPAND